MDNEKKLSPAFILWKSTSILSRNSTCSFTEPTLFTLLWLQRTPMKPKAAHDPFYCMQNIIVTSLFISGMWLCGVIIIISRSNKNNTEAYYLVFLKDHMKTDSLCFIHFIIKEQSMDMPSSRTFPMKVQWEWIETKGLR